MTIASVAFVPAAPLLVPLVAGGSAPLDDELRTATLGVVAELVAAGTPLVVIVAPTDVSEVWEADATWSFHGFGLPPAHRDARAALPWPLGIGAWLLDECGCDVPRRYVGVPPEWDGAVDDLPDRAVVLAVGDGSACRTEKAPGHLDPRAEGFDDSIATILASGDVAGLLSIDPGLGGELLCCGMPVWRWVACAAGDAAVRGAVLVSHVAPYGVGYFVASWSFG
jgi:hypothetical protein